MKEVINNKVYDTDCARMVKYDMTVEDLGSGYTRYHSRSLYQRPTLKDYFLYVYKVSVDSRSDIFATQEYIIPVTEDWARGFRHGTPEIWPAGSFIGRPRE